VNRAQRRAAARAACRGDDVVVALDRSALLRIVAQLVEMDSTVSGATIIQPDDRVDYLDANTLRRGGRA
jgi:hypothetical protein